MSLFLDTLAELIARAYYRRDFVDLTKEVEAAMARIAATGVQRTVTTNLESKESNMSAFDDLKAATEAYIAAVDVMITDINALIAAAIAADDAGEDVNLNALKDQVLAAQARLPTPPAA